MEMALENFRNIRLEVDRSGSRILSRDYPAQDQRASNFKQCVFKLAMQVDYGLTTFDCDMS